MTIKTLEVFKEESIVRNNSIYREFNVSNYIGHHEIAGMAYNLVAGTGQVDVSVQGSFDGVTWNTAVDLALNVASDGAADFFVGKDLIAAYPLLRFKATEDNTGTCTGFTLLVALNSVKGS